MVNGKIYIGQTTTSLKKRWRDHKNNKNRSFISRAIHKYGAENFEMCLIDTAFTQQELDDKEKLWIGIWKSQSQCARDLGLSQGNIGSCLRGERSFCGGYRFAYINGSV